MIAVVAYSAIDATKSNDSLDSNHVSAQCVQNSTSSKFEISKNAVFRVSIGDEIAVDCHDSLSHRIRSNL